MTLRALTLLAVLSASSVLCACATPARFEWGAYESALYIYAKKPDRRPDYRAALEAAVEKGRKTDRIAPGLLAELGYLHLEDGDTDKAVSLFEEEMRRFPEARPFLGGVIARAKKNNATTTE
ncbi:DUF4810 domain-containing protein [Caulobacter sp.]|jgi:hypothetical protein|uniref:DUF4810 domain-containing protein n=1 Tax=Caulobacter sp. TaxID=78 RepID=UPI0031DF84D3